MILTVTVTNCYVTTVLITCITQIQIPFEEQNQRGVYESAAVHAATSDEWTTRLAKPRSGEDQWRQAVRGTYLIFRM
jgi:hypothetical protein